MPATLTVSYTSVQLMLKTLPEVGSVSTVTSELLAHYAGRAEAEINARIGFRYSLPLGVDVPILTALATDLGLYYALSRKPLVGSQSKADPWLERFKEARDLLKEITEGKIELLDSDGGVLSQRTDNVQFHSTTMDYLPTFFEGGVPEDWQQDPDKTTDDLDARDL